MDSSVRIYMPSFIKMGSKVSREYTDRKEIA
jgi:hypothetical protein